MIPFFASLFFIPSFYLYSFSLSSDHSIKPYLPPSISSLSFSLGVLPPFVASMR